MTIAERYAVNCSTWSDIQDHLPLLKAAACDNVMEIGVRTGMSTSALLAGIEDKGGHLWSVDVDACGHLFTDNPAWTFIKGDSILHAKFIKALIPEKLTLLFVDGDHSYRGCLSDLQNFGDRARRIFVHDADCPETFPGVLKAIKDYATAMHRDYIVLPGSYGLGVNE